MITHMERRRRFRMKCYTNTHAIIRPVIINRSRNILSLPTHGSVIRRIVASGSCLTTDTLASVQIMCKQIAVHCQFFICTSSQEVILQFNSEILRLVSAPRWRSDGNQVVPKTCRDKCLSLGKPVIYQHIRFHMLTIDITTT